MYDNVEYLASLGRAQTANVKRDADIGVAEANRDAGIRVCKKGMNRQGLGVLAHSSLGNKRIKYMTLIVGR